jgi:hypothetical protein
MQSIKGMCQISKIITIDTNRPSCLLEAWIVARKQPTLIAEAEGRSARLRESEQRSP